MSLTHIYAADDVKIHFFIGEAIIPAETVCYYLFISGFFLFYKKSYLRDLFESR